MTDWKPVIAYMNNYYRNTKVNVLYVRECIQRRTLAFPSKTAAERFPTR